MKNALIIGGSTGMGFDTAKRLALSGDAVTITGRDTSKLEAAAAALRQEGAPRVITKSVDLYNREQVDAFATEISTGPAFDYLVNSTGYFSPTTFLKHTRENYHQYHNTNESLFFLTQAVA